MSAPRRFRWLRRMAAGVLILLVSVVAIAAWLVATPSGARFAITRAMGVVPGELLVARIDGTLLRGLTLEGITYVSDGLRARVDQLVVGIAPGVVFNFRRLTVRELTVRGVRLETAATETAPAAAPDLSVPVFEFNPLPLAIEIVAFELVDATLVSDGVAPVVVDRIAFSGQLERRDLAVSALEVRVPGAQLDATGSVALNAALAAELTLNWRLDDAGAGRLELQGDRSRYTLRHDLSAPYAVATRGVVSVPGGGAPEVDLVSRAPRVAVAIDGRVVEAIDLRVALVGQPDDWRVSGGTAFAGPDLDAFALSLEAAGDMTSARVTSLVMTESGQPRLRVTGSVEDASAPRWQAQLEFIDFGLMRFLPQADATLTGVIAAEGMLGESNEARARTRSLVGRWREYDVAVQGAVAQRGDAFAFENLSARLGDNTLTVDGTLGTDANAALTFALRAPDLAAVSPDLRGQAFVNGRVRGALATPMIEGDIEVPSLAWADLAVTSASARVALTSGLEGDVDVTATAASLQSGETRIADVQIAVAGDAAAHRVTAAASMPETLAAQAVLSASGAYADATWTGIVDTLGVTVRPPQSDEPVRLSLEAPAPLTLARDQLELDRSCLKGAAGLGLCAQADIDETTLDAAVAVRGVDIATWLSAFETGVAVSGVANAEASLVGPRNRLSGAASLAVDGLEVAQGDAGPGNALEMATTRLELELDAGQLAAILDLQATSGASVRAAIDVGDAYAEDDALSGELLIAIPDVTSLNAFSDTLEFSTGALEGRVVLGGTRRRPTVASDFDATAIAARLLPLGIELRELRLSAGSDDRGTLRFNAGGRSGDGQFTLEADARLLGDNAPQVQARVRAEAMTFLDLPDLSAVASLDLDLNATPERQSLTGTLDVDRASFRIRGLPEGAVRVSNDVSVLGTDDAARDANGDGPGRTVNVTVTLSDDVQLEGFGLRTGLNGTLQLRKRAAADLEGVGVLQLDDATYEAYGQQLEVSRGQLVFSGPLDQAALDIRAERTVGDNRVGIDIEGTPDNLSSELFSEPTLPDADAFSLLLTGRPLASAGTGDDAALADAALTLGLKRAFGVSSAIRDAVGLDTLTVAGSGRDGRVLAGKQLSNELYLEYAYGVFDQVSTVLLRLQLSNRLSLESQSGDTQSVDLVYSVGSR